MKIHESICRTIFLVPFQLIMFANHLVGTALVSAAIASLFWCEVLAGGQGAPAAALGRGPIQSATADKLGAPIQAPAIRLSDAGREDDWAAIGAGPGGRIAVAWVAYDGKADCVVVREGRRTGDSITWSDAEVAAGPGDFFSPAVAYDGAGTLWVVWSANLAENFELFVRRRTADGWQEPMRLTHAPGSDIVARLAADPQGNLRMAWQGFRNGSFDILLARLSESGLADEFVVTQHAANDWAPALAIGPSGEIYVVWDTYRNGSYDVYLRRISPSGEAAEETPIAASPAREANAAVAVDASGRAWVAYDIGEENWGRHVRLHGSRSIGLHSYQDGLVGVLPVDFMASLPDALRARSEYPQLAFDGRGCLHVAFQHFIAQDSGKAKGKAGKRRTLQDAKGKAGSGHGIFFWYATATDGKSWSPPTAFGESNGRGDSRLRLVRGDDGGVYAAWAADGRQFPYYEVPMNGEVFAGQLNSSGMEVGPLPISSPTRITAASLPPDPNAVRPRQEPISLGGASYRLVFGDMHRHTDISRCALGADGTLSDTYRYGIDVAGLDFLAISDHDQDLGLWRFEKPAPEMKGYPWWRSEKLADVYTMPGRFLALYGYERGRTYVDGGGHKNVIYARRGYPVSFKNAPEELFAELTGREAVVIPHQLADGAAATDWAQWNGQWERVAEIFQARGSYEYSQAPDGVRSPREGCTLWDAYERGARPGIIASSDHGLTHHAYAGVFVRDFSRQGILEALRDRRTFGATEVLLVTAVLNGKPMGQEITTDAEPDIEIMANSPEPLAQIEVIKNNRFVLAQKTGEKEARLTFHDADSRPGSASYYYVRVTTAGGTLAWTSPFWVKRN